MIQHYFSIAFALGLSLVVFSKGVAQELRAYAVYNSKGKQVDFGTMSEKLLKADVVLFGELHNNPICHWLQLEFSKVALESDKPIAFGAEMFERDDQLVLDEYLSETVPLKFLTQDAKTWPNFETDYLPLLDLARDAQRPFIATNVPRRYASLVSKKRKEALDSLSAEAKQMIAPLPFEVTINDPGYIDMREMMGLHNMGTGIDALIEAQALKDYTMSWNIFTNLPSDGLFIHFNGSFHSQNFGGIYNYLKALDKKLKVSVIATVEAEGTDLAFDEEWKGLGDFVIVVSGDMTKTH